MSETQNNSGDPLIAMHRENFAHKRSARQKETLDNSRLLLDEFQKLLDASEKRVLDAIAKLKK